MLFSGSTMYQWSSRHEKVTSSWIIHLTKAKCWPALNSWHIYTHTFNSRASNKSFLHKNSDICVAFLVKKMITPSHSLFVLSHTQCLLLFFVLSRLCHSWTSKKRERGSYSAGIKDSICCVDLPPSFSLLPKPPSFLPPSCTKLAASYKGGKSPNAAAVTMETRLSSQPYHPQHGGFRASKNDTLRHFHTQSKRERLHYLISSYRLN